MITLATVTIYVLIVETLTKFATVDTEPKKKRKAKSIQDIKIVSYTGRWPNLCSGILTFRTYSPGGHSTLYAWDNVLESNGTCCASNDYEPTEGPWSVRWDPYDPKTRREMEAFGPAARALLEKRINDSLEKGCCGGCA